MICGIPKQDCLLLLDRYTLTNIRLTYQLVNKPQVKARIGG